MRAASHVRVGTQDERVRAKLEHLVPVPSEVECGLPAQRTGQVGGADAQLEAAIPEATDVLERRAESGSRGNGDRKSTRLNSSHLVISYAVFCLKKKKKIKQNGILSSQPKTNNRR